MTIKNKTTKRKGKSYLNLIIMIILSIILIKTALATPQIQLMSQTNPLEYTEIQIIILNITGNTNITQAEIEFEQQNHTLEKEGQQYTYSWIPKDKGINIYEVHAKDSQNQTQTYTDSFTVQDTTPPEIIETQPQGDLDYNLIELTAITNENTTCRYDLQDLSYDSMNYELSGHETTHTKLRSLGDGAHVFYVKCRDTEPNTGQSKTKNFTIDTTPPKITGINPTGTVTQEQQTLSLKTNEPATCKWGTTNQEYNNLGNQFQITGDKQHQQPITLEEGINTYYISCKDQIGNKNPTITINTELNLPPTASISIEQNNTYEALTQGTYEITLIASEPLSQAPSLKLQYNTKLINIPLQGSTQTWSGYLIIPENSGEHPGEFIFNGKDQKGVTGTEITSGKLIIIDTKKPGKPKDLRLLNKNNKIEVSWNYEGEETYHYKIYRSTTGKTDKADYKTTTTEAIYQDWDVTNKIGYFYRISAVDKAGNEGELSEEEFLMTEYQNSTPKFVQEPELLTIINEKINQLERIVQDLEIKILTLEKTNDKYLLRIINELELVNKQGEIKNKIQLLIGELKTYKETQLTKTELDTKIQIINTKTEEYQKGIIKEVWVRNKVQNEQIPEENLIQETITKYLENKILTQEQKTTYYKKVRELQDEARVIQDIISYEIEYEHKESQSIIIIIETIQLSTELKGVLVQEIIPREIIKISELNFTDTPKEINTVGIVWLLDEVENSEISYRTTLKEELNKLQKIRTILLYGIDEFLTSLSEEKANSTDKITGEVIDETEIKFPVLRTVLVSLSIIIVLTLLVYYFFFLKTENSYENEIIKRLDIDERNALLKIKIDGGKSQIIPVDKTLSLDSKSDLNVILNFIQLAYSDLEKEDIQSASSNYSLALILLSRANLNLKNRLKANFEINTFYEKITEKIKTKHLYN